MLTVKVVVGARGENVGHILGDQVESEEELVINCGGIGDVRRVGVGRHIGDAEIIQIGRTTHRVRIIE